MSLSLSLSLSTRIISFSAEPQKLFDYKVPLDVSNSMLYSKPG